MKRYLGLGLLLILIVNVFIISGALYNRSAEPLYTLELSEREFNKAYSYAVDSENSGKTIELSRANYRRTNSFFGGVLSAEQLAGFGLSIDSLDQKRGETEYYSVKNISVFVAVEFAGDSYERNLEEARVKILEIQEKPDSFSKYELKSAKENYDDLLNSSSRLYYIDAHQSDEHLAKKYSNNTNIFLLKGRLGLSYNKKKMAYIINYVDKNVEGMLLTNTQGKILPADTLEYDSSTKFRATMHVGKRYETWISDIKLVNQ
jgi:hypothetical protein